MTYKLLIPSMPEYGYHQTVNRHTLKRWKQEWKVEQFKKKDVNLIAPSFWLSVGATLITLNSIMA